MNNTVIFSCGNDFAAGTCKSLVPAAGIGRGALVLAPEAVEGEFVSPVLAMDDFSTVVVSWNTDLPEGAVSEAFCRVQAEDGQWSQWLSWGQWSPLSAGPASTRPAAAWLLWRPTRCPCKMAMWARPSS